MFEVQTESLEGKVTAVGSAGPATLIVDRPIDAGGGGLGFNGGELLLSRSLPAVCQMTCFARRRSWGLSLTRVGVRFEGDFAGDPAISTGIVYEVDVDGDASDDELDDLVRLVDEIGEIPNSLRQGTAISPRRTARGPTSPQLHAVRSGRAVLRAWRSVPTFWAARRQPERSVAATVTAASGGV